MQPGVEEQRDDTTGNPIRNNSNIPEGCQIPISTGIGRTRLLPRQLERADLEWADLVVRVGCGDMCPVIPGRRYLDWNVQDPNETDPETTRRIRDEIARRVGALLFELQGGSET